MVVAGYGSLLLRPERSGTEAGGPKPARDGMRRFTELKARGRNVRAPPRSYFDAFFGSLASPPSITVNSGTPIPSALRTFDSSSTIS